MMIIKAEKIHVAKLIKLGIEVPHLIETLDIEIATTIERMESLSKAGLIDATNIGVRIAMADRNIFICCTHRRKAGVGVNTSGAIQHALMRPKKVSNGQRSMPS